MSFWFSRSGRVLLGAATLAFMHPGALAAQRQNGLLLGRVLSGDVAVPGAAIFVSGGRVTIARVDGRYRLSLPAGRYEVRAQRIGYTSARDSITVASGQELTANFRLDHAPSMLSAVASLGTKVFERAVIDVPAPVEVVQGSDLRAAGATQTSRMLQSLAAGINAPRPSVAEGSDLVHPVTLRGLGPDQVLVLVNGRRRHSSALLNANTSAGRGTTGVDLDAIPASMIERIEILRDGAAAQYGAEAVAGVINVVLKSGVHGDAMTTVGGNATTYNRIETDLLDLPPSGTYPTGERSVRDGRTIQASIDKGIVFGERGFLHGALEVHDRELTNRALPDPRLQYPATDPRAAQTGLSQDLVTNRLGDPASRDVALFLNGGNLLANGLELYGNAGGSRRTMEAAGVFRRPVDAYTNTAVYPDGYLPVIRPTIGDYAGTFGMRGALEDWRWDLGTTYGRNAVDYQVRGTQLSNGAATGTFDQGGLRYGQSTTTLELTRNVNMALVDELRLALGTEFRHESYGIVATGQRTDVTGFSGFGASLASDHSRHDVAAYTDIEADMGSNLLVGVAGRAERYSDVGTLGAGKLMARYNVVPQLALRGSLGRSSRPPSLAQSYFTNQMIDPGTGAFSTQVVGRGAAATMALPTLRPERATNVSAGMAFEASRAFALSADYYQVNVDDRIALLQEVTDPVYDARALYTANAAQTRTKGIDVNASYGFQLAGSQLRLAAGGNFSHTQAVQGGSFEFGTLGLGRVGIARLEHAQPNASALASATLTRNALGAVLRLRHFGEVTMPISQGNALLDQVEAARTLVDANLSYTMLRKYTFTAGADNLLDAYPSRNSVPGGPTAGAGNGYYGIFPYSGASPFGFSGRFVYGRLSIYL